MKLTLSKLIPDSSAGIALRCSCLTLLLCLLPGNPYADEREDRRIWAALDVFPRFLASYMDGERKQSTDGTLLLVLVYVDRKEAAEKMARHLEELEEIRGMPLVVEVTDNTSLDTYEDRPPEGIFITQRLARRLISIMKYGRKHHVLVISPFEEDVKQGVPGGIIISDRILPYINMEAMRSAGISIKSFFLRIAKRHE